MNDLAQKTDATALATAAPSNVVIDFSKNRQIENFQELKAQASAFIFARNVRKGRYLAELIKATVEEGLTYQYMFEQFQEVGDSWEAWVAQETPYDPDTARHYRNVAAKFQDIIPTISGQVLERVKLTALYKLAVQDIPVESGIKFFAMLAKDPQLEGDVQLATICKVPEIAARYEDGQLIKLQAYKLAKALIDRNTNLFVREFCLTENVSHGETVELIQRVYMDWIRAKDIDRPNKTWAEIVANGNRLVWQDNVGSYDIHIADVTPNDCKAYMHARAANHKGGHKQASRATCKVARLADGTLTLTVIDGTALPVDFSSGTIQVELLTDSLERDPQE